MTEGPDRLPDRPPAIGADVLSDVLRTVRLTGSMVFLVRARTPWKTHAPHADRFAPLVLPTAQRLVSFHALLRGGCWGGLAGEPMQRLEAGDVLVVPHGDAYLMADPPEAPPGYGDDDAIEFFRHMAAGELAPLVDAGTTGAASTEFVCSFLGVDDRPFNPILAELPRIVHLRGAAASGRRLWHLLDAAVAELHDASDGRREVLRRLNELMFVELVRHQAEAAEPVQPGWLAGLRDPLVGRVLARLHAEPAHPWTLDALAAAAGSSRTTLAERFGRIVGRAPMQYLSDWRMQRAAQLLDDPRQKVASIALAVGYDSEAAFSRAFRRHAGLSPARWRQR
jgi:AraC-like DNA-binding protein